MKIFDVIFKKTKMKAEDAIDHVQNDITSTLKDGKDAIANVDTVMVDIRNTIDSLAKLAAIGIGLQILLNLINIMVSVKNIDIIKKGK